MAKPKAGASAEETPAVYTAGVYRCPKCNNKIVVLVDMSAPPICWNHKNQSFCQMEKGKGK